jgi:hypothetical protein
LVHGSAQLAQTLNQHNLVDEYRLLVFPVVLGTGKRLLGDGTVPTTFKTVQARTTSTGLVALTLRPTRTPEAGHPALCYGSAGGTTAERGGAAIGVHIAHPPCADPTPNW